MKRRLAALAVVSLTTLAPSTGRAFCPCYTASSMSNTHNCGVEAVPGTNPSPTAWQDIFQLVAQGPSVWGAAGPAVPDIHQGCGKPEASHSVPARFPCEILKAIAMQESGWRQFCAPDQPADETGKSSRTIISFDCGYGIGQVTSGMHKGETPGFDTSKVASDPTYNLATGTLILAGKWKATNCVGDNQPSIVEDWYTAVWAYNGLAYSNNPSNPNLDPNRGVWDPKKGGSYAYQERVFGWVEHPPATDYWPAVALAYPDRKDVGTTGQPPALPEPSCASPTDCTQKRAVHTSLCFGAAGAGGAGGSGAAGSTGASGSSGAAGKAGNAGGGGATGKGGSGGTIGAAGSGGATTGLGGSSGVGGGSGGASAGGSSGVGAGGSSGVGGGAAGSTPVETIAPAGGDQSGGCGCNLSPQPSLWLPAGAAALVGLLARRRKARSSVARDNRQP